MDTKIIIDQKQVMIRNKIKNESESIPWQQIIKSYHETALVRNNKCKMSHTKSIKIKQYQSCNLLELF